MVYRGYQADLVSHQVGVSTVLPTMTYQDRFQGYEGGSSLKYPLEARFTATLSGGSAQSGIVDLGDAVAYRQPVRAFNV